MFSFLSKFKRAKQAPALDAELQSLVRVYPLRALPEPSARTSFPPVTALEPFGLGAYHMSLHLGATQIATLEALLEKHGFTQAVATQGFRTLVKSASGSHVSAQTGQAFGGTTLILITDHSALIDDVRQLDLAPPAPWIAFPEVDAEALGSLQGTLEYWWSTYWLPYWNSLNPAARAAWLQRADTPEGWRDYLQLHEALNGQGSSH